MIRLHLILGFLLSGMLLAAQPKLETRSLFDHKVEILVPVDFTVMDDATIETKYPLTNRPQLVFTNPKADINLGFTRTTVRATQALIAGYHQQLYDATRPSVAKWHGDGVRQINGRQVGYLEFTSEAIDQKIHNLIFFTDVEGVLLLCTFNCVEKKFDDWAATAQKILNSLTVRQ